MRKLRAKDVTFTLTAEQDDLPVRGNAMASGDDEVDKAYEDQILARLDHGDEWAWASVTVRAEWNGFVGEDHLGGCCYRDEADFTTPGGYYDDMKQEALRMLNEEVRRAGKALATLG